MHATPPTDLIVDQLLLLRKIKRAKYRSLFFAFALGKPLRLPRLKRPQ